MIINGVECVSLAHHLTDSPVVQHDYFGTDKVRLMLIEFTRFHVANSCV